MAQTGFTPILIYSSSTTTNVPSASNLTNSTLGSELAINITDGKLFYKDNAGVVQVIAWKVVPATAGGTGQTSYAVGDILYADTTTSLAKLADVATGNALISGGVGVAPAWGKIGLTTHVSGTLPVANGGTGITSFGSGVATWLGTPSSANLAAAVTDETGSGALVFGTGPTITDLTVSGTGGNVYTDTYTPTLTNTTNVSASTAVLTAYTRVADSVIISGRVSVTTTATGSFTLGISLPIASNLQVAQDAVGPCASSNATHVGLIRANTTTDVMEMVANATSTAATVVAWSATYRIR
jgi:hypothetical protein